MDVRLTDDQELLRRSVREFAETELGPHVMAAFGVGNWLNILLLFTVLALAEFFFLSRG